jgi:hypothetical protein
MNEPLDISEIPGLGPVRREALAAAGVTDLPGLLEMKVAELAAVRGIGVWQARRIREFLRHRGLLVETEDEGAVVFREPRTPEEARAISDSIHAMEAQAEAEAQVQAEVKLVVDVLHHTVEGDPRDGDAAREIRVPPSAAAPEAGSSSLSGPADAGAAGNAEAEDGPEDAGDEETPAHVSGWQETIRAQREELPEVALALMEAIRQASVTQDLTRQMTRLLIAAGEFLSDAPALTEERRREASALLSEAEKVLHRAIEKRSFSQQDQKDVAKRVRKRRKALESILAAAEEGARRGGKEDGRKRRQ